MNYFDVCSSRKQNKDNRHTPSNRQGQSTTLFLELVVLFAETDERCKGGGYMIKLIEIGKGRMRKDRKGRAICILVC